MTINGIVSTVTWNDQRARGTNHPPVILSGVVLASQGELPVGLIVALDKDAKIIPWEEVEGLVIGEGDDAETTFSFDVGKTTPGSVEITDGVETFTDDGNGNLVSDADATAAVVGEVIDTGDGGTATFAFNLGPIVPGSLTLTDGVETFADSGTGVLTGNGDVTEAVSGEVLDTGDGGTATFAFDLGGPIDPTSLVITDGVETFSDSGTGILTGDGATTDAVTGETIGTGDNATKLFSFDFGGPIVPGSVAIGDGTEAFTDDGTGVLTGDGGGSGRVNYATGAGWVLFNANVANEQAITADYTLVLTPGSGTVNYLTGVGSVTFQTNVVNEVDVEADYTKVLVPGSGTVNYATGVGVLTFQTNVVNEVDVEASYTAVLTVTNGKIDYPTGKGSVTFQTAVVDGVDVEMTYTPEIHGVLDEWVDTTKTASALYIPHGSVRQDVLKVGATDPQDPSADNLARLISLGIYPE